ncbi:hypothetical protein [Rhodoplanes azumiensis]|uniref:DUF7931 domain-containing protein n=1 Tax=Rhodoplanes azumiensis TaxID=1897628 RepID=A0ABW5AQ84_9BRAD
MWDNQFDDTVFPHLRDDESYRAFVEKVSETESSMLLVDRDAKHAAILLTRLFQLSRQSVDILTGRLDDRVYGTRELMDACIEFLNANQDARLRILSEMRIAPQHPLLKRIQDEGFSDRLEISLVPDNLRPGYHLAVGDALHFRFEPNGEVTEAFVKFGDRVDGSRLQSAFDSLHNAVREYEGERAQELVDSD